MTTTSKPPLAVGQKGADNLTAVLATDLVKATKFKNLLKTVKDNIDRASVVYPVGTKECLTFEQFKALRASQDDEQVTYLVDVPVSKLNYKQGQIRLVRPEFCVQNFNLFGHVVDFSQSEFPVAHYDEKTDLCDIIKKQHLTAQVAAIAVVKEEENSYILRLRLVAFQSKVTEQERNNLKSKLFYSEVKGVNDTKEWEKLLHQCAIDEPVALATKAFYESIPGLTWQPYAFPFPYIQGVQFCCTKVSQLTKVIQYATNDDSLNELRAIVQTLCNTLDWEREAPKKELSVYLIRAFYNFEKRLHPLLDDAVGGLGYHFDILEHIEQFFAKKTQKTYLGGTTIDKKPWQHLVKVADHVNTSLIESGQRDSPFFSLQSSRFVDAVYALANPSMGKKKTESVDREYIEKYIKVHVRNFN
jgi:hypothetical protein